MSIFRSRKKRIPALFLKKEDSNYSLLLRKKRQKIFENGITKAENRSIGFLWKKYRSVFYGVIGGGLIFLTCAIFFFFSHFFSIEEIMLTRRDFRANVEGITSLLLPYKGQNIFLLSKKNLSEKIIKKFPEIKTVDIERNLPRTLQVTVETYPILVKWEFSLQTKEEPQTPSIPNDRAVKIPNTPIFLNSLGRVSVTEPEDEGKAFLIQERVKNSPREMYFGYEVFNADRLQKVLSAKDLLAEQISSPVVSAELLRDAQEVHFISENGVEFWCDFSSPFEEQILKISKALREVKLFEMSLEYIDLRVPGKLIYKPK